MTAAPLPTADDWLTAAEFARLFGLTERAARNALSAAEKDQPWRGLALDVRRARGRGGKRGLRLEVRAGSLPPELFAAEGPDGASDPGPGGGLAAAPPQAEEGPQSDHDRWTAASFSDRETATLRLRVVEAFERARQGGLPVLRAVEEARDAWPDEGRRPSVLQAAR